MDKYKDMRISPISRQDWTLEIRDILKMFSQYLSNLGLSGEESEKDSLSPVLSCLLQHPNLARTFLPFGRYLLMESTLDSRCRELVILRATWLWRCEYEWAHHSMAAIDNGLFSETEIKELQQNVLSGDWLERESLLVKAVNELHESSNIETGTWDALTNHFNNQQMLDIVFTVGGYVLSGFYMNAIGLPLKEGMKGFPDFMLVPSKN